MAAEWHQGFHQLFGHVFFLRRWQVAEFPDGTTEETGTNWSDEACSDSRTDEGTSYCESCRDAALGTVMTAIMGLVTMLPTIQTNIQRYPTI